MCPFHTFWYSYLFFTNLLSPPSLRVPISVLWVLPEITHPLTHSPTHLSPFRSMRGSHTMSPWEGCLLAKFPLTSPVHPNSSYYYVCSNRMLPSLFGKTGLVQVLWSVGFCPRQWPSLWQPVLRSVCLLQDAWVSSCFLVVVLDPTTPTQTLLFMNGCLNKGGHMRDVLYCHNTDPTLSYFIWFTFISVCFFFLKGIQANL